MTAKELIEILQKQPEEIEVFMSSDCEGNSFSPCHGVGRYKLKEKGLKVLVLWPSD